MEKHKMVMTKAEELLSGTDLYAATIYDNLSCGKLGRLLGYIKKGSTVTLRWPNYTETIASTLQEGDKCIIKR